METIETGNGNWKLKTEIKTQPLRCCSPRMLLAPRHPSALLASSLLSVALLAYPCSQAFAIPSCSIMCDCLLGCASHCLCCQQYSVPLTEGHSSSGYDTPAWASEPTWEAVNFRGEDAPRPPYKLLHFVRKFVQT